MNNKIIIILILLLSTIETICSVSTFEEVDLKNRTNANSKYNYEFKPNINGKNITRMCSNEKQ